MSPFPNDPYCYPGTDTLRNIADIRDPEELRIFEADAVAANIIEIRRNRIAGPFNAARLKETHRRIFGNVYPWAGEFRQGIGMMTKESSGFVVTYGPSENVPAALASTFAALRAERDLHGLDAKSFAGRLAFYYSELDAIHAFREETRGRSAPFRPTWRWLRDTGSIGPKRRWLPIPNSAFTMLATWQ
jgi:cell filamentation protein